MRPSSQALAPITEVIERCLGTSCSGARADVIADVICRQMEVAGSPDPVTFAAHLERDAAALRHLAESVRVPETFLLRESGQLRVLREDILPGLAADRRSGRYLRLWSAGCSSGEEAYSLAIVLEEAGLADRARIVATDRSEVALEAAGRGAYRGWSFRNLDVARRRRYFTPSADQAMHVVVDRLRRAIAFQRHDLVVDAYPRELDVIVCRNVLLYLTPEHGAAVVERLASALAPGGWLILGSADPHHAAAEVLEQVRTPAGSLYRRPLGGRPTTDLQHARTRGPGVRPDDAPPPVPTPTPTPTPAPTAPGTDATWDALDACERQLAERPLDATVHSSYATLLLEAGQPERALRAGTGAVFLAPELVVGHLVVGRAHLAMGDPMRASRAFAQARLLLVSHSPDDEVPGSSVRAGRLHTVAAAWEQRAAAWSA